MSDSIHRIAIVILNWNGKLFLEKFLPDVIRFSAGLADVVVADNASTDDSIPFLEKEFPGIRIIRSSTNRGYTGGYNFALKQIQSEFYILLNSDVQVTENWIQPMLELMDSHPQLAACQPKIKSFIEQDKFEYAGAAGGFIDTYGYPFCRGRIFLNLEKDQGQYDNNCEIFWATGACLLVRAAIFHELGGFDEAFFAHMEEIDFCWRIHSAGYQVWYCGRSHVYHVGGGTLPKNNPQKTYFNFRNNLFMMYKNSDPGRWPGILLFRSIFDFFAALKFLYSSGWEDAAAVYRAHRSFHLEKGRYRDFRMRKKPPVHNFSHLILQHSILFTFYLRGKKKFSEIKL